MADFHASFAGIAFKPVDTISAVSGLLIVPAGRYAVVALARDRTAESSATVEAEAEAGT